MRITQAKKIFFTAAAVVSLIIGNGSVLSKDTSILSQPYDSKDFAFKLFAQIDKNNKNNVVISPFSAYIVLSMILNGAGEQTRQCLADVLGIAGNNLEDLNCQNYEVINSLAHNEATQVEIGRAIFADFNLPFKDSFIDIAKQVYSAEAINLDINLKPSEVLTKINTWCNNKTHGKIPTLTSEFSSKESLLVLNSVYFKGAWQYPFDKVGTHSDQCYNT